MGSGSKLFFEAYCSVHGIPAKLAARIVNGRYRPFLSSLDGEYCRGKDVWEARQIALKRALDVRSVGDIIDNLRVLAGALKLQEGKK